ncbi:winged helix DNA-binding domain-containing protein [Lentzea roselyniae]|uniref:Winged helix DNA-binding domain-containing protein n=2 Tax=Pseudonocardiaceae TaxID=2070 RepID=A0ABP7B9S2_9PSEU
MEPMSWHEACARRLVRHSLTKPSSEGGIAAVVSDVCGIHAQVMSAAEVSIGLRVAKVSRVDVRNALWESRELVKTFGPRGTVHLLATADLPMWIGAVNAIPPQPPRLAVSARMTPDQLDEVVGVIGHAVRDAELTVDELDERVIAETGPWAGDLVVPGFTGMWPRWRTALQVAANRGVLCFGPDNARRTTYTSPARWLPGFTPMPAEDAVARLVLKYLRAYGPATPQQFAQWLTAPKKWASEVFAALGDRLRPVELDGVRAWLAADDDLEVGKRPRGLRLLPYFDVYVIGSYPREAVFPGRAFERALSRGQAGPVPVVLIDGVVAGVWHQKRSGKRIDVKVEPFRALSVKHRTELDRQVTRAADVQEGVASLEIGTVDAGKHL